MKKKLPQTKVSDDSVRGIRWAYEHDGSTMAELAEIYGVSRIHIWRIINRKRREKVEDFLTGIFT